MPDRNQRLEGGRGAFQWAADTYGADDAPRQDLGHRVLNALKSFVRFGMSRDAGLLVGVQILGVATCIVGLAIAAVPTAAAERVAKRAKGEYGDTAFARLTRRMDPSMLSVADRHAPRPISPMFMLASNSDSAGLRGVQAMSEDAEAQHAVLRLQDLSPEAARIWNADNPIPLLPNPAAKPFLISGGVLQQARAIDCLTAAVYYEAAFEPLEGQRAVAQVVLNRMRHPAYPKSVCGVVFQGSNRRTGCQFTFTCDGALARKPHPGKWEDARKVAEAALTGYVQKEVGHATHYHANYVAPYWSPSLIKVATIGAHIFYRWTGGWGMPGAFGGRYDGQEMGLQYASFDDLGQPIPEIDAGALEPVAPVSLPMVVAVNAYAPPAPSGGGSSAMAGDDAEQGGAEPVTAAEPELVTAVELAPEPDQLRTPEELDWLGRPKPREDSRRALPPARMGGPGGGAPGRAY